MVICTFIVGCNEKQSNGVAVKPKLGAHYFDFDEAIYYNITDSLSNDIDSNPDRSATDSIGERLLSGRNARELSDTIAIAWLDSVGFSKRVFNEVEQVKLREIFREKSFDYDEDETVTTCAPVFRDIYLFKKEGKPTGIVKICYDCGDLQIIGAKADTKGFGYNGEYKQLYELVKK